MHKLILNPSMHWCDVKLMYALVKIFDKIS